MIELVTEYICDSLDSFHKDPADSDYQRGYEAALRDLGTFICIEATMRGEKF